MFAQLQRLLWLLLTACVLSGVISPGLYAGDELVKSYFEKKSGLRYEYRLGLVERMKTNPYRMEVVLLKFDGLHVGERESDAKNRFFYLPTEDCSANILQSVMVEGSQRDELQAEVIKVMSIEDPTGGAMCHDPVHGLRIVFDDKSFESIELSLCWACSNIGFAYPDGNTYLDTTPQLQTLINSLVPIPETELKRFKNRKQWEPRKEPGDNSIDEIFE